MWEGESRGVTYSFAGFLRKVYGILTAQLGLTVLVVLLCLAVPSCKAVVQGRCVSQCMMWTLHPISVIPLPPSVLLNVALVVGTLVTLVVLIIKRHDAPTNYYLLAAFVSS